MKDAPNFGACSEDGGVDCISEFLRDDDGSMVYSSYGAVDKGERGTQVPYACVVWETARDRFFNVLRFIHELPPSLRTQLNS